MNKDQQGSEYPKIRKVTRKDRKVLSGLIKAFAERSGNVKLTEMIPGNKGDGKEADTDQVYELVKSVMTGLVDFVEEDLTVWFMDLTGITDREKYDALPFDIEIHIIDELMTQKGFNNFFTRASGLFKKIRGLAA